MRKPLIRISEAEAAGDFPSVLTRVRAGAEFVIERDANAVAVIGLVAPQVRLLSESLRVARERRSDTILDGDFGRDLEDVVSSHREPLNPPCGTDRLPLHHRGSEGGRQA
jgi:antitoxin (DNA-binding transcriptional repressor) of toxin-antitoxin stability system